MTRILTPQTAELNTATVQINTLTVSGKQVTLAVFRQLTEARLINEDGAFTGTPWGTVNYHPDRCADHKAHWHVVFQVGDELRRDRVDYYPRWRAIEPEIADHFVTAAVLDWLENDRDQEYFPGGTPWKPDYRAKHDISETRDFTMQASDGTRIAVSALLPEVAQYAIYCHCRAVVDKQRKDESLAALRDAVGAAGMSFAQLHNGLRVLVEQEARAHHETRRRISEIAALPQLFIAV